MSDHPPPSAPAPAPASSDPAATSAFLAAASDASSDALLTEADINRIRWRCRRGLLENDIFIERFFAAHATQLTQADAVALLALMDLSDNDLLDLHLGRKNLAQLAPALDNPRTQRLLTWLKTAR